MYLKLEKEGGGLNTLWPSRMREGEPCGMTRQGPLSSIDQTVYCWSGSLCLSLSLCLCLSLSLPFPHLPSLFLLQTKIPFVSLPLPLVQWNSGREAVEKVLGRQRATSQLQFRPRWSTHPVHAGGHPFFILRVFRARLQTGLSCYFNDP